MHSRFPAARRRNDAQVADQFAEAGDLAADAGPRGERQRGDRDAHHSDGHEPRQMQQQQRQQQHAESRESGGAEAAGRSASDPRRQTRVAAPALDSPERRDYELPVHRPLPALLCVLAAARGAGRPAEQISDGPAAARRRPPLPVPRDKPARLCAQLPLAEAPLPRGAVLPLEQIQRRVAGGDAAGSTLVALYSYCPVLSCPHIT